MGVVGDLDTPTIRWEWNISYGPASSQFGVLRIPKKPSPFTDNDGRIPVVILIHGGGWNIDNDLGLMRAIAADLSRRGYATWNLEFRRIGEQGGGWPTTILDVGAGIDHIRSLADNYPLDLSRVIVLGHSAGGQLSLWAGGRGSIPFDSELFCDTALIPRLVIGMAPVADLTDIYDTVLWDPVTSIPALLGGGIRDVPSRVAAANPKALLPFGIEQLVVQGLNDLHILPENSKRYVKAASDSGDCVELIEAADAEHLSLLLPTHHSWRTVAEALSSRVCEWN